MSLRVAAIVLAAGKSSRLGRPKQLVVHRGRSLVRNICEEAMYSGASETFLVVGAFAHSVREEVETLDVSLVQNNEWFKGMGSSLKCGLRAARFHEQNRGEAFDAYLVLLCDQPGVSALYLNELLREYEQGGCKIAASRYDDTLGVPALFCRSLGEELLGESDQYGARGLITRHADAVRAVDFPLGVYDVDVPADVESLRDLERM